MTTAFAVIGYAFALCCAIFALLWAYEQAMNNLWKRCIDSHDFYKVVVEYAKVRRRTRKNERVGFSDE